MASSTGGVIMQVDICDGWDINDYDVLRMCGREDKAGSVRRLLEEHGVIPLGKLCTSCGKELPIGKRAKTFGARSIGSWENRDEGTRTETGCVIS